LPPITPVLACDHRAIVPRKARVFQSLLSINIVVDILLLSRAGAHNRILESKVKDRDGVGLKTRGLLRWCL
jgi:hypothetical protein